MPSGWASKPGRGRVGPGVIIYSIGTGGDFKLVHQWTLIYFNGFILAMAWILVTNFLFKCIYKRPKMALRCLAIDTCV